MRIRIICLFSASNPNKKNGVTLHTKVFTIYITELNYEIL